MHSIFTHMPIGGLSVNCDGTGGRRGYWSLHNLHSTTLQYTVVFGTALQNKTMWCYAVRCTECASGDQFVISLELNTNKCGDKLYLDY